MNVSHFSTTRADHVIVEVSALGLNTDPESTMQPYTRRGSYCFVFVAVTAENKQHWCNWRWCVRSLNICLQDRSTFLSFYWCFTGSWDKKTPNSSYECPPWRLTTCCIRLPPFFHTHTHTEHRTQQHTQNTEHSSTHTHRTQQHTQNTEHSSTHSEPVTAVVVKRILHLTYVSHVFFEDVRDWLSKQTLDACMSAMMRSRTPYKQKVYSSIFHPQCNVALTFFFLFFLSLFFYCSRHCKVWPRERFAGTSLQGRYATTLNVFH